ncbi:hypothetical protein [Vibrio sp. SCSIO 43136]|uniref:hypothetical protein n=1 Tax=Vibrio sp. SCSIO 43136 TaxID=2819101 RepID=UPI002074AEFA|nr:hypothetical protein [Vibrio sp. SCSIO 43136]USD67668.1 hypothetical protein J4N39_15885 [Vibrio sp. SCSIO 43136]
MELQTELEQWDGKSTDYLHLIYQEHHFEANFIDQLLEKSTLDPYQESATWLLKHHLESEEQLTDQEMRQVYQLIPFLTHWQAKLHLLQIMPYLPVQSDEKDSLEQFIKLCIADRNKFLRAWAYNALFVLSQQYSEYLIDVKRIFKIALKKEAPSIKARIKNILIQHNLENQVP